MTTWTYWIVGTRDGVDQHGRSTEWATVSLCRSSDAGAWERFVQNRHCWALSSPPERRPIEAVDESEARALIDTWIGMRMTPPQPLGPRAGDPEP